MVDNDTTGLIVAFRFSFPPKQHSKIQVTTPPHPTSHTRAHTHTHIHLKQSRIFSKTNRFEDLSLQDLDGQGDTRQSEMWLRSKMQNKDEIEDFL